MKRYLVFASYWHDCDEYMGKTGVRDIVFADDTEKSARNYVKESIRSERHRFTRGYHILDTLTDNLILYEFKSIWFYWSGKGELKEFWAAHRTTFKDVDDFIDRRDRISQYMYSKRYIDEWRKDLAEKIRSNDGHVEHYENKVKRAEDDIAYIKTNPIKAA